MLPDVDGRCAESETGGPGWRGLASTDKFLHGRSDVQNNLTATCFGHMQAFLQPGPLSLLAARLMQAQSSHRRNFKTRENGDARQNTSSPVAMPTAKRQKKSTAPQSQLAHNPPTAGPTAEPAPRAESEFAQLAKQHWLKPSKKATKVKVKNDVLKQEIWDPLEKEKFPIASLLALEALQILER